MRNKKKTLQEKKRLSPKLKYPPIKTKDLTKKNRDSTTDHPNSYATDTVSKNLKSTTNTLGSKTERFGRESLKKAPDTLKKAKSSAVQLKRKIYLASNNIKTRSAAESMKKAKEAAKVAQTSVKASQKAAQAAKVAAERSARAAKATAKAIVATVKATISAVKSLTTLIAAGGWVVVVVILFICMTGFILSSGFGIFYSSNGNHPDSKTIPEVIEQISQDFATEVERIKQENPHDEVIENLPQIDWREVIAVFAVKYALDPDNPTDVVNVDQNKFEKIRSIFWDMYPITYSLETVDLSDNDPQTILHITVNAKNCWDMATRYDFNPEQRKQLDELLKPEYNDLWDALLKSKL